RYTVPHRLHSGGAVESGVGSCGYSDSRIAARTTNHRAPTSESESRRRVVLPGGSGESSATAPQWREPIRRSTRHTRQSLGGTNSQSFKILTYECPSRGSRQSGHPPRRAGHAHRRTRFVPIADARGVATRRRLGGLFG